MASALRFSRRSMALSSSLLRYQPLSSSSPASSSFYLSRRVVSATIIRNPSSDSNFQHRSFHSTTPAFNRRWDVGEEDKIKPDEILFEGCDYNHWLITMDFPKDPKPSPEEMVETYVQTAAKVLGSVEEAKKKIYACSTTTYEGFQVEVSEEMSEKFKGLPGVVFVLPDSYIDPVNKQYGGDKYDNGVITPRPPPIQYGRQGRYGDRNRNYDRPRYDRNRDSGMQQVNQPYARQGPMQGDGRNYAPQQNYGPPGDRRDFGPPGQSHGPPGERRDFGPPGQNYGPPGERRDFGPGQNYSPPGERRDFGPSGQSYGPPGERRDFGPGQSYSSPGERRDFPQSGGSAPQGQVSPPETGDNRQGSGPGYSGDYRQGSGTDYTGGYRQGSGPSYGGGYRQGSGPGYSGDYRQGSGPGYSGDYRQGSGPGYSGDQSQRSGPGYGGDLRQGSGGFGGDNAQRAGSGYGGDATPGSASGYGQN